MADITASELKNGSMKALWDVERIGLADFVHGFGQKNADGFWVVVKGGPAKVVPEGFDPAKVTLRKSHESWGPVTKDDAKIWLTVL